MKMVLFSLCVTGMCWVQLANVAGSIYRVSKSWTVPRRHYPCWRRTPPLSVENIYE